jgi:hypothetical protein
MDRLKPAWLPELVPSSQGRSRSLPLHRRVVHGPGTRRSGFSTNSPISINRAAKWAGTGAALPPSSSPTSPPPYRMEPLTAPLNHHPTARGHSAARARARTKIAPEARTPERPNARTPERPTPEQAPNRCGTGPSHTSESDRSVPFDRSVRITGDPPQPGPTPVAPVPPAGEPPPEPEPRHILVNPHAPLFQSYRPTPGYLIADLPFDPTSRNLR